MRQRNALAPPRVPRRKRPAGAGAADLASARQKRELYDEPPEIVIRTLMRWLLNDPEYQRRFLLFLSRAIPPEGWLPPSLMGRAAIRGGLGDLRRLLRRGRGDPSGIAGAAG